MHRVIAILATMNLAAGQFNFLNEVNKISFNPIDSFKAKMNEITVSVVENPTVQNINDRTGEAISKTINAGSAVPNSIASAIGYYHIPTIESNVNLMEYNDIKFMADYNAGLHNEDAKLGTVELITKYGFPAETHIVETEDGYRLKMHRIPGNGSVVFLMHGLFGSANDYLVAGPESALAYELAREGYDVWMGNARGNTHSRAHRTLQPSEKKFWDFSWHQIGVHDLPAMIDFVLKTTNSTKLKYVGFSQGTTSFFVMASERPEYNEKISVMVALSPVAFMSNMKSPVIRLFVPGQPIYESIVKTVGAHEFAPDNLLTRSVKRTVCGVTKISEILCSNIVFLTVGFDMPQLNVTNLPVVFAHEPAGAATNQMIHYGQGVRSGDFAHFSYGTFTNERVYGNKVPPSYKVEQVTAPVALMYSDGDWMADVTDVRKLASKLSNVVEDYLVPFHGFNHLDFIIARDVKTLVYDKVKYVLKKY
ncbi:lipase 3-like [Aricia agestis]|uniref:lipase 3-like n=1 Tax=Aricia agestis TaxID=91739 RepID=UPI001C209DF3|nr:lipase 3-like [Aricia agestis]